MSTKEIENDAYDAQFEEEREIADSLEENLENNSEYEKKRNQLEKTKIVKQTWSILEIFRKISDGDLILNPDYQRNVVWKKEKQVSFVESLFMEIMIPPIYVVEVPADNLLENKKYEVVDGKQRLTTIKKFIENNLRLDRKFLEYYSDILGGKNFSEISNFESEKTRQVLSSILDIYVITSNSPAETKYDIFARLNKGAEPLKVNEIRKAIYRSNVTKIIDNFVEERISEKSNPELKAEYESLFSTTNIKRFDDYGRFYRSVSFYKNSDIIKNIVKEYNSRPKDMIDRTLQELQSEDTLGKDTIENILNRTVDLLKLFSESPYKDYLVDACIPFINEKYDEIVSLKLEILNNGSLNETFVKSIATTTNVNKRLEIISSLLRENDDE